MKDICLCIVKETDQVHSIGVKKDGRYYSEEGGGYFDLRRNTHLLNYVELTWQELRNRIKIDE